VLEALGVLGQDSGEGELVVLAWRLERLVGVRLLKQRCLSRQSKDFTVKLKTAQDLPEDKLVLRTSLDNWTVDRKGEMKDGVFYFKLDTAQFSDDFECKFVILPNRWMHDPNLVVASPAPGEDITFTDSRVVFDPPAEENASELKEALEAVKITDQKPRRGSDADDDAFVSVPPTPDEQEKKIGQPNGA